MNLIQLFSALDIGIIFGLVAIGVFLTFRIMNFPDLTVEGSFPLGAAISITLITHKIDPVISIICAGIGGGLAGFVTAYLNTRWKILGLLAGILVMSAVYSINLRIMGVPNLSIFDEQTIYSNHSSSVVNIFILTLLIIGITGFLKTNLGLSLRAVGINPKISRAYGINPDRAIIIILVLSNSIIAIAGAMFAQMQEFADISMGGGIIISGLASVIIGEAALRKNIISYKLINCILGAIIYRLVISMALNSSIIGLKASDLNLITSLLIIIMMMINVSVKRSSND